MKMCVWGRAGKLEPSSSLGAAALLCPTSEKGPETGEAKGRPPFSPRFPPGRTAILTLHLSRHC